MTTYDMKMNVPAVKHMEILKLDGHLFPGQRNDAEFVNTLTYELNSSGATALAAASLLMITSAIL